MGQEGVLSSSWHRCVESRARYRGGNSCLRNSYCGFDGPVYRGGTSTWPADWLRGRRGCYSCDRNRIVHRMPICGISCFAATQHSLPPAVSYTHLRAHETRHDLVCRLLLEKKK